MPQWIHDRARHLQAKNPSMPEGQAFAIATQQSHALGKSPKGYGTAEGRQEAKQKYDTPRDDKKTADPGGVGEEVKKVANIFRALAPAVIQDQDDRFRQIIREELSKTPAATSSQPSPKPPQGTHPHHHKTASLIPSPFPVGLVEGFSDELRKIAQLTLSNVAPKPALSSQITSKMPRMSTSGKTPNYSQINQAPTPGPAQMSQPVLSPPPVRG